MSSLLDLETLFIEKLQEKYKLNMRDLKRAFSRFDKDNNGLLDLHELVDGFKLFLNGVRESQIAELVSKYDMNGDGKISFEEFLHFLTSRTAIQAEDGSEYLPAEGDDYGLESERASEVSSVNYYDDYNSREISPREQRPTGRRHPQYGAPTTAVNREGK